MNMVNLDDANESVFYIPFEGSDEEQDIQPEEINYDALDGPAMRWDAYKAAWTKCLNRVQSLVHALYEPTVAEIVEKIQLSYNDVDILPALPHPELPAIAVTNPSSDTFLLSSIIFELSNGAQDHPHLVTHLYPSGCPNLSSAISSIITGFISSGFRSSARSLASYDINVLEAWYNTQDIKPRLILLLHDFEQFDPGVIQDLIYICSLHVSQLPLILLISLSSPQSPSYLHVAYPRATLKLLRLHRVVAPVGSQIFKEIIMKTFVDLEYEPDITLGPAMLEYLAQYATRFNPSVDSILGILQLAHLKHFLTNPLSALVQSMPTPKTLKDPSSSSFLGLVSAALNDNSSSQESDDEQTAPVWETRTISDIIKKVNEARIKFRSRVRKMRLSFLLLQLVHDFLLQKGYKGLGLHWGTHPSTSPVVAAFSTSNSPPPVYLLNFINLLQRDTSPQAQANKDLRYVRVLLRKLKPEELNLLLEVLVGYFEELPEDILEALDLTDITVKLNGWRTIADEASYACSDGEGETGEVKIQDLRENLAEWLFNYLSDSTTSLDDATLWSAWYTGMAPFPSETLNPSVRGSILAGLLRPRDFAEPDPGVEDVSDEEEDIALWRLPDTSILFHRYLDSGKMINVYDWFESFHGVLGTQRREEAQNKKAKSVKKGSGRKSASPRKKSSRSKSPIKPNVKGKGRANELTQGNEAEEQAEADGEADKDENDFQKEEMWKILVQARFIRALHELDLLGLVKHTRRKPDHVLRTVFEIPE